MNTSECKTGQVLYSGPYCLFKKGFIENEVNECDHRCYVDCRHQFVRYDEQLPENERRLGYRSDKWKDKTDYYVPKANITIEEL